MSAARQRQRQRLRSLIDDCRSLKSACNLIALILILLVHKVSKAPATTTPTIRQTSKSVHMLKKRKNKRAKQL